MCGKEKSHNEDMIDTPRQELVVWYTVGKWVWDEGESVVFCRAMFEA